MFGLSKVFAAFARLASAVDAMATLFEVGNERLREQLGLTEDSPPAALPDRTESNGAERLDHLTKADTVRSRPRVR